ncbi:MAG: hypothetical protein PVJ57_18025 [Phycisphaerae bacterium]|jgi:type IV pilus assembly protein PilQ
MSNHDFSLPAGVRLAVVVALGLVIPLTAAQGTSPAQQSPPNVFNMLSSLVGGPPQPATPAYDEEDVSLVEPGGEVGLTDTGLLDVHVRDMALPTLLEMLSYEARANIVSSTSVTGSVSANLYAVTLEQALSAILTPNQYDFRAVDGTIFVGTAAEITALSPPVTRVFELKYLPPEEAVGVVKAVLGDDARVSEGGKISETTAEGSFSEAGGFYLIVTCPEEDMGRVAELLAQVDRRPQQVLIEATILRATLNESNQFGIDFALLGGVDFQNVGGASNATADLTLGALPSRKLQNTTFNVNTQFTSNVTGDGFSFGLIKDNVASFIRALEEVTDVVVVANPKIVSLNKQEGQVIVGRRDGYLTTTVTETAAVQTVEYLETGTQLKFRPVISDDGTVRLIVHPKDSNGGLTAANLPFEETTEAHADILLKDGNTILIGGLFRERTVGSRSQLPVLGNIPIAGLLFQSRNDQTVREEVIILLTVHVLKDTPQEAEEFRELLQDVERVRVGNRMGLLGTGRERLAQAFYHEALRQLEAGDSERALLNVRMTLNNQPKHMPAMHLKERLLGERLWDDDGTRMRTFLWRLIHDTPSPEAPTAGPFGRPDLDDAWPDAVTEDSGEPQP